MKAVGDKTVSSAWPMAEMKLFPMETPNPEACADDTLLNKNNGRGKPFCAGGKIFPSWCEKFSELPKKEPYPCLQENQSANR